MTMTYIYILPLLVDEEGQMARFVAKTLRVCNGLVLLGVPWDSASCCCHWRGEL